MYSLSPYSLVSLVVIDLQPKSQPFEYCPDLSIFFSPVTRNRTTNEHDCSFPRIEVVISGKTRCSGHGVVHGETRHY